MPVLSPARPARAFSLLTQRSPSRSSGRVSARSSRTSGCFAGRVSRRDWCATSGAGHCRGRPGGELGCEAKGGMRPRPRGSAFRAARRYRAPVGRRRRGRDSCGPPPMKTAPILLSRRQVLVGAVVGAAAVARRTTGVFAAAARHAGAARRTILSVRLPYAHLRDPRQFPSVANRVYTSESTSIEGMRALHRALHMDRVVIVQPSVYGTDNACTLAAVRRLGTRARAVAVIDTRRLPQRSMR